ncbi:MAG: response regulator transcription factor [Clostridiales bacterium]|nr:response regulator transcription factor [Clostridiales bacterium]
MRILIAEDDRSIATAVKKSLMAANYAVDHCDNGLDAYDYITSADYDVIIMDIMMPGEDGLSVVRRARQAGVKAPILFLTARDAIADRVEGLDAGGDDYLVKPFALDELMARVRVLSRRSGGAAAVTNELKLADLVVDTAAQKVTRAGKPISLTGREYTILEYMLRNQGIVLSRDRIEQNIFNYEYEGASNMVDVYIRYLRKKLDDGFDPKLIHTVRGVGYVMRAEA